MKELEKLYAWLKEDRKYSPYSAKHTLRTRLKQVVDEVEETLAETDHSRIEEELGDVMQDLLACFVIAEEQGISLSKAATNSLNKMRRRKPWVDQSKAVNPKEELRLYSEAKSIEQSTK